MERDRLEHSLFDRHGDHDLMTRRRQVAMFYARKKNRDRHQRALFSALSGFGALFDGDPAGGGTEVTTIVRVAGRPAATAGQEISFGASAGAVSVSHVAIFDLVTAGNLLKSVRLPTPADIGTGNIVEISYGRLVLS